MIYLKKIMYFVYKIHWHIVSLWVLLIDKTKVKGGNYGKSLFRTKSANRVYTISE